MDDLHGQRAVRFSWENKPGASTVFADREDDEGGEGYNTVAINLPPPPCPSYKPGMFKLHHGEPLHVPLPPCAFDQRPLRSSSKRGFKTADDPFLMAFKECTKSSPRRGKSSSPIKTLLGYFSCKTSSHRGVRDERMVRIPQPQPLDTSLRGLNLNPGVQVSDHFKHGTC